MYKLYKTRLLFLLQEPQFSLNKATVTEDKTKQKNQAIFDIRFSYFLYENFIRENIDNKKMAKKNPTADSFSPKSISAVVLLMV